jgi:hypothetical protein
MEDLLEQYARPVDPKEPVVCLGCGTANVFCVVGFGN